MRTRAFVGAAVVATLGMLVLVALLSATGPDQPGAFVALLQPDPPRDGRGTTGEELRLSVLDGEAPTAALAHSPHGHAVILVKAPMAAFRGAAEATGQPATKWVIEHPSEVGMGIVAYNAKSTHLGCTVQLLSSWGIQDRDGVPYVMLLDPCHQGQWNALAMAQNQPDSIAPRPLGVVPVAVGPGADPVLYAGPSIDQKAPFDAADFPDTFRTRIP